MNYLVLIGIDYSTLEGGSCPETSLEHVNVLYASFRKQMTANFVGIVSPHLLSSARVFV